MNCVRPLLALLFIVPAAFAQVQLDKHVLDTKNNIATLRTSSDFAIVAVVHISRVSRDGTTLVIDTGKKNIEIALSRDLVHQVAAEIQTGTQSQ